LRTSVTRIPKYAFEVSVTYVLFYMRVNSLVYVRVLMLDLPRATTVGVLGRGFHYACEQRNGNSGRAVDGNHSGRELSPKPFFLDETKVLCT
jgi:hypothetical protein